MRAAPLLFAFFASFLLAPEARAESALAWAESVGSPRPAPAPDARDSELLALCGKGDAALHAVAARLANRELSASETESLTYALRVSGDPHVRPRAWTLSGTELSRAAAMARLGPWLRSFGDSGERRCGVASAKDDEDHDVFAVVVVHAQADLAPLPIRLRPGEWLNVDARFRAPVAGARVVVLGPWGAPRPVLTSFSEMRARARFRADRAGSWLVQVLLEDERGPRPVLEALVFAGMDPPSSPPPTQAPGESTQADGVAPEDALTRMVNAARIHERLAPLARDPLLDELARIHAGRMRDTGLVAHDVGAGTPRERMEDAGASFKTMGENVAHSKTVALAHRALWGSPSHRGNLLHPRFARIGIGVVQDPDGSIWVAQLFAGD